ncbi:MAG: glycosyltransferase family 2 protein [Synechococcus sp.]
MAGLALASHVSLPFYSKYRSDWLSTTSVRQPASALEGESPIFPVEEVNSDSPLTTLIKTEGVEMIEANEEKLLKPDLNIRSLSVIIPVYNCEKVIKKTLYSICESIDFFKKSFLRSQEIGSEIIIVNDASSDNTLSVVTELARLDPSIRIVGHPNNRGAAAARNTGVKNSHGDILFFCDGDDLFLAEHIYLCFMILQGKAEERESFKLVSNNYNLTINLPEEQIDAVNTGVKTKEEIHPYWKKAIENSIPLNLCVRRKCHQFIEGFLDDAIHQKTKTEDCAYNTFLKNLFNVAHVNLETVEYIRYPNNAFDKQLTKFQLPPGEYKETSHIDLKLLSQAHKIEQEKLLYLRKKKYRNACQDKGYQFAED